MKKILAILLILIFLWGCTKKENILEVKFYHIRYNDEKIEIKINNLVDESIKVIKEAGVVMKTSAVESVDELSLNDYEVKYETNNLLFNQYVLGFIPTEEDYQKDFYIRAYIIYVDTKDEEIVIYTNNYEKINVYQMAKTSSDKLAKKVVATIENKIVKEVSVTLDTKEYIVDTDSNQYEADIFTDYNIVKITVTVNNNLFVDEDLIFKVNDEVIERDDYNIDGRVITYEFDDPNWTKPY